ncbi:TraR/DksA C4-type zinc finger protein [Agarilytica rhodophyticola]|uniref:TraR/DksA C4-type zinc finger protein n=1 Tax=Agarilytica rhodophyticola TaxID=1737490 RepID=UPI000B345F69|nr:TraR/DksA C4-type zinc finger protein [Agarilytica rhodophyticola]
MNTSKPCSLTEEEIINAPESEYMNKEQLGFFRQKLLDLHKSTCVRIQEAKDQMVSPMDFSDPSDRASCEEQSNIALRIVEREQKLLPKIQQSLERIRLGEYGYCLESGEPIGIPRLLARPTAEYCAEVKTLKEIKENHYNG